MPLQVNPQSALAGLLLGSNGVGDDGACFLAGLLQVRDPPSCDTLTAGLLQLGQCALTQLDLSVEVRPCPKDARVHRAEVEALGGKQSFPFLVDPNGDGQ